MKKTWIQNAEENQVLFWQIFQNPKKKIIDTSTRVRSHEFSVHNSTKLIRTIVLYIQVLSGHKVKWSPTVCSVFLSGIVN